MSSRNGATMYSRQAVATVLWSIPRQDASNREDQCVTSSLLGGGRRVAAKISRLSIRRNWLHQS